jgi:hypothetical protein
MRGHNIIFYLAAMSAETFSSAMRIATGFEDTGVSKNIGVRA